MDFFVISSNAGNNSICYEIKVSKSDFKNDINGCNEKMLIEHLNLLLKENFIEKTEYDIYPKKTEYILTEKGEALLPILTLMQEYGKKYLE